MTALTGETFPLFKNDNGTFFRDVTYASGLGGASIRLSGWGNALADFDNDGFKDLVTANSHANDRIEEFESATYRQPNAIFRNVNGKFQDVSAQAGRRFRRVPRQPGHRCRRLRQRWPPRSRRQRARRAAAAAAQRERRGRTGGSCCVSSGQASNREGLGARVHLGSQWNHMTTAVGYASSSDYGVHFGLGSARTIERIEIRWPSGIDADARERAGEPGADGDRGEEVDAGTAGGWRPAAGELAASALRLACPCPLDVGRPRRHRLMHPIDLTNRRSSLRRRQRDVGRAAGGLRGACCSCRFWYSAIAVFASSIRCSAW